MRMHAWRSAVVTRRSGWEDAFKVLEQHLTDEGGLSLPAVDPKTAVKSMLSSKNFRPYINKYGEVVSSESGILPRTSELIEDDTARGGGGATDALDGYPCD